MKIRELLQADWTVDRLYVTVRTTSGRYVTEYCIGPNLPRPQSLPWICRTKAGDVYSRMDGSGKTVIMDKTIQFYHSGKQYKGVCCPVGVMLEEIPAELVELEAVRLHPTDCGRDAHGWHGYRVDVVSDLWLGVTGENEIIEKGAAKNA